MKRANSPIYVRTAWCIRTELLLAKRAPLLLYLVKVFLCGSHLFPGLIEQLNADAEKLLHQPVLTEEDGVVVGSRLRGCEQTKQIRAGTRRSRDRSAWEIRLTWLSDPKDFTQDERELDAAPGKGTLVFVLSTAVLQDKLKTETENGN